MVAIKRKKPTANRITDRSNRYTTTPNGNETGKPPTNLPVKEPTPPKKKKPKSK